MSTSENNLNVRYADNIVLVTNAEKKTTGTTRQVSKGKHEGRTNRKLF